MVKITYILAKLPKRGWTELPIKRVGETRLQKKGEHLEALSLLKSPLMVSLWLLVFSICLHQHKKTKFSLLFNYLLWLKNIFPLVHYKCYGYIFYWIDEGYVKIGIQFVIKFPLVARFVESINQSIDYWGPTLSIYILWFVWMCLFGFFFCLWIW